jgi:diadenosine tetraphosphatase ApaH/serine/threonine PP2A family protein phosphatase
VVTGDLVNRGPKSLEVLRFAMKHDHCVQTVLGNHDLHLLAVAYGGARLKKGDTLDPILNAVDNKVMLEWLRHQPMFVAHNHYAMVHAGLLPDWDIDQAHDHAEQIEQILVSDRFEWLLQNMYGNKPKQEADISSELDRLRFSLNVMTRMRVITQQHELDFDFKGETDDIPEPLTCRGLQPSTLLGPITKSCLAIGLRFGFACRRARHWFGHRCGVGARAHRHQPARWTRDPSEWSQTNPRYGGMNSSKFDLTRTTPMSLPSQPPRACGALEHSQAPLGAVASLVENTPTHLIGGHRR